MPIFKSVDDRFDDVEYTIESQGSGDREWYFVVYKDSQGNDDPCSRRYRKPPTAQEVAEELEFSMKYWGQQLDDRERAIVADQTHYRWNPTESGNRQHNGFGGRGWRFRSLATGEVLVSHNVWFQGKIPVWAASCFPDTHEVLPNI